MKNPLKKTRIIHPAILKEDTTLATGNTLRELAFDNAAQANIITTAGNGKILIVNDAACKLLGYSKEELLTKSRTDIFDINETSFKNMLKQRTADGHSIALVTAIKKSGNPISCEITSALFTDENSIEKAITTIVDLNIIILKQKKIDTKNEKIVAHNINLVKSEQKKIDTKNEKIIAYNIDLAKSEQKKIDTKNEKIVAHNINMAKSEQKKIDTKNEKIVAYNIDLAKSEQKKIDTKNEKIVAHNIDLVKSVQKKIDTKNEKIVAYNIDLAKSEQKKIDTKKEKMVAHNIDLVRSEQKNIDTKNKKIVSDNILVAQAKSDARQVENNRQNKELEDKLAHEIKLKQKQIVEATEEAKETERSDIGKELRDNINQLLAASRIYLEMAKRGGADSDVYLSRSSEYTLTAIEAISKLTKALTTDIIKNLGLCSAIEKISIDTMEVCPVKITSTLESFNEDSVNDKFKLNVYRIIQEQMTNILKHANATEVNISLLQNERSIVLTVSDNGVGFDTEKKYKGVGLANIKNRAVTYNGMADFVSHPSLGCVLTARFPLTDPLLNKH